MSIITRSLAIAAAVSGLVAGAALAQSKGTIGIAMPTKSSARWIADGTFDGRAVQGRRL